MRRSCEMCIGDNFEEIKYKLEMSFGDGADHCPYCGRFVGKNIDFHTSEPPTIVDTHGDVLGDTEEAHPAYAQLSFSRQSGGYINLYGSAIKHQETISMTVSPSRKQSSKWSERYYAERMPLIEVRMSASQFAQAITSMNMGSGVPVTLETLRGKRMPKCEEMTVSEVANKGLEDKMAQMATRLSSGFSRVEELLNKKGTLKVAEKKEIYEFYSRFTQDVRYNLPYLHECMTEAYDKTATATKADIEAFYVNAVMKAGLDAMKGKQINNDYADVKEIEG